MKMKAVPVQTLVKTVVQKKNLRKKKMKTLPGSEDFPTLLEKSPFRWTPTFFSEEEKTDVGKCITRYKKTDTNQLVRNRRQIYYLSNYLKGLACDAPRYMSANSLRNQIQDTSFIFVFKKQTQILNLKSRYTKKVKRSWSVLQMYSVILVYSWFVLFYLFY